MFFADGISRFTELLATHPPLPERIIRLDPHWDGQYPEVKKVYGAGEQPEAKPKKEKNKGMIPGMPTIPGAEQIPIPVLGLAEETVNRIGTLPDDAIASAEVISQAIPQPLREAAQQPFTARALIYALLLDSSDSVRQNQLNAVNQLSPTEDLQETLRLEKMVRVMKEEHRLPLVDITIPALRQLSKNQYLVFKEMVQKLIEADGQLSLLEYAISSLLKHYLEQSFEPQKRSSVRYFDLEPLMPQFRQILSRLAYEGNTESGTAEAAYQTGIEALTRQEGRASILPESECNLNLFDDALSKLREAHLKVKEQVIRACAACILADEKVTIRESELLRVICGLLDCPLPLLTADHDSEAEGEGIRSD